MRPYTVVISAALAMLLPDCQSQCTRDPNQLWTFQVLGVSVDPPSPAPGTTATLTLVTADTQTRAVQVEWFDCPAAGINMGSVEFIGGLDAGTDAGSVSTCLQSAPFGTGMSVTYVIPNSGNINVSGNELVLEPTVLGYACAGGTIGPPGSDGVTPTCNGSNAQGWLFTRTIASFGDPLGSSVQITDVTLSSTGPGTGVPIHNDAPPTVQHCQGSPGSASCPIYQVTLVTSPSLQFGVPGGAAFLVDLATFPGCYNSNNDNTGRWMQNQSGSWPWIPPSSPGTAHLYFQLYDVNAFVSTERTIVVQ